MKFPMQEAVLKPVGPPALSRPDAHWKSRSHRWTKAAHGGGVDFLLAFVAVGGMGAAVLADLPVRSSVFAASDLKTLYAAAFCFRHGLDAYAIPNLRQVFQVQGMPLPVNWYGHAPVYPPFTLALLAPLTLLPMAQACLVWTLGSLLLMALAVGGLLRCAALVYDLPLGWRAAIAGVCAAGPLLPFALNVGNLSVAASALAILAATMAFAPRERTPAWVPGLLLGGSLLLKPHLALWVVLALLLLPGTRGRRIGVGAALWAAVLGTVLAGGVGGRQVGMQVTAFGRMVRSETAAGGSMFPGSREALPVVAQIPSLDSLLGFWSQAAPIRALEAVVLLALLVLLVRLTRKVRDARWVVPAIGAWCAFGMLTTYHRAHDAVLLLLLTPFLADRLRRGGRRWEPWAILAAYVALSMGPTLGSLAGPEFLGQSWKSFFLLRQAALAALALCLLLLWSLRNGTAPALQAGRSAAGTDAFRRL